MRSVTERLKAERTASRPLPYQNIMEMTAHEVLSLKISVDDFIRLLIRDYESYRSKEHWEMGDSYRDNEDSYNKSPLWSFTRRLKWYLKAETTAINAWRIAARVVNECGGWGFASTDEDAAFAEFTDLWATIRNPGWSSHIELAAQLATAYPLKASSWTDGEPQGYNRFFSLVVWLQHVVGPRAITIPCRDTATKMATTKNTISRWTRRALHDGWLEKVKAHSFNPSATGSGRAAEYKVRDSTKAWVAEVYAEKMARK